MENLLGFLAFLAVAGGVGYWWWRRRNRPLDKNTPKFGGGSGR